MTKSALHNILEGIPYIEGKLNIYMKPWERKIKHTEAEFKQKTRKVPNTLIQQQKNPRRYEYIFF